MTKMKMFGLGVGCLVVIVLLGFGGSMLNLWHFQFFAPKFEDAKRNVFENTQSYNHGKIQDLAKYYHEYMLAKPKDRDTIKQIIIFRFAEFDETKINAYNLRSFLVKMRGF